ncbi:MAG: HAMP domain-containing sensor histidine kinase [Bacteroidales bacterium]|nr:HAMP domain-containing sensor histidine kinase [Bacteroidales bacterium]
MSLRFKYRLALFNTMAVAITTAFAFIAIYWVVFKAAYSHLDNEINHERFEVLSLLDYKNDSIIVKNMPHWDEAEHQHIEVNPTFVQIKNSKSIVVFHSTNLGEGMSLRSPEHMEESFYNGELNGQKIRMGEFPVINREGKHLGIITVAVSQRESIAILNNLIWVLIISFPLVLIIQFLASSVAASRGIKPVHQLIKTASGITDSSINRRLTLPVHHDELYDLTLTMNELFSRIEKSMIRQKQFTSDASHEIRTPLSAIRGTLEVLIRRQRNHEMYEEKITDVITQVDRLNVLLDQLLQLARFDSETNLVELNPIDLVNLIINRRNKWALDAVSRNITIHLNLPEKAIVLGNRIYLELMMDNLMSNAIKYGNDNGNIFLVWLPTTNALSIQDDGIGISSEHLPNIFNRFYRTDESRSILVKGNGLGLSIVKKMAHLQNITLSAESELNNGSTFTLHFHADFLC